MTSKRGIGTSWHVLASETGYLANEFEQYNGTARRPRLAIVEDLQQASIYPSGESLDYWQMLAREVIGVEVHPTPIRFIKPQKKGEDTKIALLASSESRRAP